MKKSGLDKLIEQILSEIINIKLSDNPDGPEFKSALKLPNASLRRYKNALKDISGIDKNAGNFSDDDFEGAYDTDIKDNNALAADYVRTKTSDTNLRNDLETIYSKSKLKKKLDGDAAAEAAEQARILQQKKDIANRVKSKSGLLNQFKEFRSIFVNRGNPGGVKEKTNVYNGEKMAKFFNDLFNLSFDVDDHIKLKALYDLKKINTANLGLKTKFEDATEKRKAAEEAGTIKTKGYTKFLTNNVYGSDALDYLRAPTTTIRANFNPTVFTGNLQEPWRLDPGDNNIKAIKKLIKDGNYEYLNNFYSDKSPDKIFIHNLKVFQKAIGEKKIETKNNDWWKKMVERYQKITATDPDPQGGLQRTALTDQPFMTQAAGDGRMLDSQFSMFKTFFEGTPTGENPLATLSARVKKLTDFTKELYNAPINEDTNFLGASGFNISDSKTPGFVNIEETSNMYVEYLNKIMVFDYFNAMAKELDSGASPYVFEAFCAYLAGGRVAGKETGLKGGMGETDFFFDSGAKGSAKYLREATKFKQSVDNFLQGVTVTYVFAAKKGEKEILDSAGKGTGKFEKGKEVGVSDPDKIHFIDLYVVNVTRLDQKLTTKASRGKKVPAASFSIEAANAPARRGNKQFDAKQDLKLKVDDSQVEFDVSTFDPVGRFYLVQKDKKNITQNLDSLGKKMDNDNKALKAEFEKLTKFFRETFEHLGDAREKVSVYANTGDLDKGKEAKGDMDDASNKFTTVMNIVNTKEAPTSESINKSIDGIIESIIKQKLLK